MTTVLGAVGAGMANEAGKAAWESAGGLVRRIAGREVVAPVDPGDLDAVARVVYDGVHRDPALARAWSAFARSVPLSGGGAARPELPPSVRFFTDRRDAMKALDREASRAADGRPRIALLHGAQGMGTSALAVHWGCREAAKRFPDGRVYVDLRGFSAGSALDGSTALRAVLRELGVPEEEVPPRAEDRVGALRRIVADRRLLMVLDHAYSAAQVRPLLTSAPGVFVLVVAANALPGLDAVRIPVGPLAERDAVRLLTEIAGKQAVSRARATLPSVLARCGGSPFALRAAASRLADLPETGHVSVPESGSGSDSAATEDPVRTAAHDAYRLLDPATARLYRLMSLWPWPTIGPAAASWIGETDETEAARLLDELAAVQLLELTDAGGYFYRPAVRRHAEDTAHGEDRVAGCAAAVARAVAGCLDLALRAANAALPESWRVPPPPTHAPSTPAPYADRGEAMTALIAERGNLFQAVHAAEEFADFPTVVLLGQALWPLQLKAGYHDELLPALRVAVRTADAHFPDTRAAGALHAQLAHTLIELRRYDEAESAARSAAADERAAGHVRGHASSVEMLGLLRLRQWRFQEAYDCFDEAGRIYDTIQPGGEGATDLPRARALLERHRGRALRGLGDREAARERLGSALRFFRAGGEAYNTARTLTDLAETSLADDDPAGALPLIDEAIATLATERAEYQLAYLASLRQRCVSPPSV
ncbi:tetratricopeptide repeat protein [Streptomyces sp. NBC_01506]|uniref:tetratricopeptide repeat protein n=1 Tax=Streptomyces sp. NBC_01506 TaxID=2903887 RepID=UPI00386B698D